jgi:uncharacterized protein YjbJ (UPF0337 family)
MSDQQPKGAVRTAKGSVKEVAGKLTGDRNLEAKGKAQQVQGKAQGALDDAEDAVSRVGQN